MVLRCAVFREKKRDNKQRNRLPIGFSKPPTSDLNSLLMLMIVFVQVGLAFSGGGVTAMICTICMRHALDTWFTDLHPDVKLFNMTFSAVSGGTLGSAIYGSVQVF